MARVALTLVVACAIAPAALAGSAPALTAQGAITSLSKHAITLAGQHCRITAASPSAGTLRLYYVGADAKIVCKGGVLERIGVARALPPIDEQGTSKPSSGGTNLTFVATSLVTMQTMTSATSSSSSLQGSFWVTALGGGSITAGAGSLNLTCKVGDGSPDLSDIVVGTHLGRMDCRNGVLTGIAASG